MHASVTLESPHQVFTNLDHVVGNVNMYLDGPTNIVSIVAKLEGESITQLLAPPRDPMDEKPRPVQEKHKILYTTQQLFNATVPGPLSPGSYTYPFNFKIPFNTTCHWNPGNPSNLPPVPSFLKGATTVTSGHIKTPLPPTLGGFPGLASIRYYVKVTVNRKEFYKENPRIVQNISFVPIEPPRPPMSAQENFGRRTYQFQIVEPPASTGAKPRLNKMFSDLKAKSMSSSATSLSQMDYDADDPPRVELDARLPEPAILTAQEKVPLRLYITRLDRGSMPLYLQSLQVELVAITNIRAGQVSRNEASSWVLTSKSNMNELLRFPDANRPPSSGDVEKARSRPSSIGKAPVPNDDCDTKSPPTPTTPSAEFPPEKSKTAKPRPQETRRITLPAHLWSKPLSATIPPSFKTCNLTRTYAVEIRVGIGYSHSSSGPGQSAKNQITLPLRLACQVWSGVRPPESLVSRMSKSKAKTKTDTGVTTGLTKADEAGMGSGAASTSPSAGVSKKPLSQAAQANLAASASSSSANPGVHHPSSLHAHPTSAQGHVQPPTTGLAPLPLGEEEPPPSYEDAMGIDLGPVDGPRNYQPPPVPSGGDGFEREGGKGRRGS